MSGTWNSKIRTPGSRGRFLSRPPTTHPSPASSRQAMPRCSYTSSVARAVSAGVNVAFTATEPQRPNPVSSLPKAILEYPIIVIYTASWATLIALVIVIFWVHKRHGKQ